jgi:SPP1 gp7 family putative phage head morphogenesis protein
MPKELHFKHALTLPPAEAIAFLKKKGYKITWDWKEQIKLNNAQVFTVAKAMQMSVLQDIRDMLKKSLADGLSFYDFKKELEPRLKAVGWWGWQVVDGKRVQLGSPHRLKTIYDTNMQSSFNVGRWKHFEENKDSRPMLRYVAVMDGSTTDICQQLDGQIHPVGSPFWNTNAPPNHYGCRSRLESLSRKQAAKAGGETKKKPDEKPEEGFSQNPAKQQWEPNKKDFDNDIFETVQKGSQ